MSSMPRRAQAQYTEYGDVAITFPYNARLVELLKSEIPVRARSYDPDDRRRCVRSPKRTRRSLGG
jgi:hypothetical protein